MCPSVIPLPPHHFSPAQATSPSALPLGNAPLATLLLPQFLVPSLSQLRAQHDSVWMESDNIHFLLKTCLWIFISPTVKERSLYNDFSDRIYVDLSELPWPYCLMLPHAHQPCRSLFLTRWASVRSGSSSTSIISSSPHVSFASHFNYSL